MSLHRAACACCLTGAAIYQGQHCGELPGSCTASAPGPIYLRDTVVCSGTSDPIEPGDIVFYRGTCWLITDDFTPPPFMRVESVTEVECVGSFPGGCEDARCDGPWYYKARACEHHGGPACVLVEFCDALAIFSAMFVAGVRLVACVVFDVGGKCYTFDASDFVGHFGDTTGCAIVESIGTWYRSCCHCSASVGGFCASSERVTPGHYSPAAPLCWRGDRQGRCCGSRYAVTWTYRSHLELFSDLGGVRTKYRDDVVEHSGTIVVGPRAECPGSPGAYGMQADCDGEFSRVLVDGFPGSQTTYEWTPSLCENFEAADDLVVNVPIGCAPGGVTIVKAGGCDVVGDDPGPPTGWVTVLVGPDLLLRYLSVNGHSIETDCTHEGTEDLSVGGTVIQRVTAGWDARRSPAGGAFSYHHEAYDGPPLRVNERITIDAAWSVSTVVECATCMPGAGAGIGGGGDSIGGGGCGSCDGGEPLEVLA